jgi:transcription elongation factor
LVINASFVEKYFDPGDSVRILEGNYKGETGIVVDAGAPHPVVKLDKTQREIKINKNCLKMKGEHDKDTQKLLELAHQANSVKQVGGDRGIYTVGEIITFNGNKTYGFILQV